MKALKIGILTIAMLGLTGVVKAEGERPDKPVSSEAKMKAQVFEQISNLDLTDLELQDETLEIHFQCTANGEVLVEGVDGGSCAVSEIVSNKLDDRKIYVDESLQNVTHHMTVRYVVHN